MEYIEHILYPQGNTDQLCNGFLRGCNNPSEIATNSLKNQGKRFQYQAEYRSESIHYNKFCEHPAYLGLYVAESRKY
jgi:hypothetical protein